MGNKKENIVNDMKKIFPVWAVLIFLIVVGVMIINITSLNIINYLEYPEMKISQIANSYMLEGEKYWLKCIEKHESGIKSGKKNDISPEDKDYIKATELFLKSLSYMEIPKVYNYLADLALLVGNKYEMYYYQGMMLIAEKKPVKLVEDSFIESLKIKTDYLPSIEKLAVINFDLKNNDNSENYVNEYLKYDPSSGRSDYLQGRLALLKFDNDKAAVFFKSSIEKDPKFLDSYAKLTELLEYNKQIDEACAVLEKANNAFPNHPSYLHRLGLCYLKADKPEKAKEAIEKALELIPNHPNLNFDLAKVYQRLGKKNYASYYLKKAIELDPSLQKQILN